MAQFGITRRSYFILAASIFSAASVLFLMADTTVCVRTIVPPPGLDKEESVRQLVIEHFGSKMRAVKAIEELNGIVPTTNRLACGQAQDQSDCDRLRLLWDFRYDFEQRTEAYLKEVTETLTDKVFAKDIWVGGSLTTREYNSKYNVIYANPERTFFSYRAEGDFYTGGAHGSSAVLLGSIDLKSGRKLQVADVIPADKRAEALSLVKDAVVKKLEGADKLQGKVTLTENFCIAEDGLHFLFQEYEIAAYCFGSIEVIIPAYGEYRRSDGQRRSTR